MSRIEKAMERAAQLRFDSSGSAVTPDIEKPEHRPVHIPPAVAVDSERIVSGNPYLINMKDPYSPISEEFRKLKLTLQKLTIGDLSKNTVLVTSAVPNEGKSITTLNLAISLAYDYDHTVLLVDADFRKPSIHRYLGIELGKGFSECLLGEAQLSEVIIPTGIGRLSVITAGREVSNPGELFASQKSMALIAEIKHRYQDRFILYDSPPVLPFAETRTLAHLVDSVLLVVKEKLPSQKNVKEAIDALKGCGLLGMVYNDTLIDCHDEKYSSYHRYNRAEK